MLYSILLSRSSFVVKLSRVESSVCCLISWGCWGSSNISCMFEVRNNLRFIGSWFDYLTLSYEKAIVDCSYDKFFNELWNLSRWRYIYVLVSSIDLSSMPKALLLSCNLSLTQHRMKLIADFISFFSKVMFVVVNEMMIKRSKLWTLKIANFI